MNMIGVDSESSEFVSNSEQQTLALAQRIGARLKPGDVIALEGELGAGKTCFVRGLAKGLGIDSADISSPTFVISQEHVGPRATLVHVDAYRLAGEEDLESIGWSEIINDERSIVAVEWPSRIENSLPGRRIQVNLKHQGATQRLIVIAAPKELLQRVLPTKDQVESSHAHATCGDQFATDAETFPFCSVRCRLADLNRWFAGRYRIVRPMGEQDIDEQSHQSSSDQ